MAQTIRWARDECGQIIDPHTAIGLAAARASARRYAGGDAGDRPSRPNFPTRWSVPAGLRPVLPARAQGLFDREERYATMAADLATVEAYIADAGAAGGMMTPIIAPHAHTACASPPAVTPGVETVAVALHAETGARFEAGRT